MGVASDQTGSFEVYIIDDIYTPAVLVAFVTPFKNSCLP